MGFYHLFAIYYWFCCSAFLWQWVAFLALTVNVCYLLHTAGCDAVCEI